VKIFRIIFYILAFLSTAYVLYNTIAKDRIDLNKTEIITGKFKSIYQSKTAKRTSISYNIEIENTTEILKIIPQYSNCFKFQEFQKEVTTNQQIELRIDTNERFLFPNVRSVVSLKANSKEYLNLHCENEAIEKAKIRIPLIIIGGLILILIIIFIEKKLLKI